MKRFPSHRLLFITGTDTGIGKTLLISLLISHLRRTGRPALAIKPFCSGSRSDAQLLHLLQDGDLTLAEVNPFFFVKPLAPLVAGREVGQLVRLEEVIAYIRSIARQLPRQNHKSPRSDGTVPILLIEGAGGLLVPLGLGYSILDVIRELRCEVIVVSANKLGTLNHTLLTMAALKKACPHVRPVFAKNLQTVCANKNPSPMSAKVVLMQQPRSDASAASNLNVLAELLAPLPLWKLPFFRGNLRDPSVIEKIGKKIEKTLAQILD